MKVLVIPEDHTYDQYILKPVIQKIFADLGRTPKVEVLPDSLGGVDQALDRDIIAGIVAEYRVLP